MGVFAFAAITKGITGLGFSLVSISILANFIGIKQALPLVLIPSVFSNLVVMVGAGHFSQTLRRFRTLYVTGPIGVLIGFSFLTSVDGLLAAGILGVVLIIYVTFAFLNPQLNLPTHLESPLAAPTGLVTGVVNGLTGVQIMPLIPYLLGLNLKPDQLVQASNCSFTICSFAFFAALAFTGKLEATIFALALPGIVLTFVGVRIGERIRGYLSEQHFRIAVLALLMFLAVTLIVKSVS